MYDLNLIYSLEDDTERREFVSSILKLLIPEYSVKVIQDKLLGFVKRKLADFEKDVLDKLGIQYRYKEKDGQTYFLNTGITTVEILDENL